MDKIWKKIALLFFVFLRAVTSYNGAAESLQRLRNRQRGYIEFTETPLSAPNNEAVQAVLRLPVSALSPEKVTSSRHARWPYSLSKTHRRPQGQVHLVTHPCPPAPAQTGIMAGVTRAVCRRRRERMVSKNRAGKGGQTPKSNKADAGMSALLPLCEMVLPIPVASTRMRVSGRCGAPDRGWALCRGAWVSAPPDHQKLNTGYRHRWGEWLQSCIKFRLF